MAVFSLQLNDIAVVDGNIVLSLALNGAKLAQTFGSKAELIEWAQEGAILDLDDLVRHAVRKIQQVDPTLSNANNFIGKTLTVTVTTEVA